MRINHTRSTTALLVLALIATAVPAIGASAADATVNVNQAGVEELALLPRIGPSTAQRIVDFREENGPFRSLEDLMLVRGIGEKTFDLLAPYVALDGATTLAEKVNVPRAVTTGSDE